MDGRRDQPGHNVDQTKELEATILQQQQLRHFQEPMYDEEIILYDGNNLTPPVLFNEDPNSYLNPTIDQLQNGETQQFSTSTTQQWNTQPYQQLQIQWTVPPEFPSNVSSSMSSHVPMKSEADIGPSSYMIQRNTPSQETNPSNKTHFMSSSYSFPNTSQDIRLDYPSNQLFPTPMSMPMSTSKGNIGSFPYYGTSTPWTLNQDNLFRGTMQENLSNRRIGSVGFNPGRLAPRHNNVGYLQASHNPGRIVVEFSNDSHDYRDLLGTAEPTDINWRQVIPIESALQISSNGMMNRPNEAIRKRQKWTTYEHDLFLVGLQLFQRGDWKSIANNVIRTKSSTQVASHAQKFFIRQMEPRGQGRRPSIHDINTVDQNLIQLVRDQCFGRNSQHTSMPLLLPSTQPPSPSSLPSSSPPPPLE